MKSTSKSRPVEMNRPPRAGTATERPHRARTFALVIAAAFCGGMGFPAAVTGAEADPPPAIGIALEGVAYPWPVHFFPITADGHDLRMA